MCQGMSVSRPRVQYWGTSVMSLFLFLEAGSRGRRAAARWDGGTVGRQCSRAVGRQGGRAVGRHGGGVTVGVTVTVDPDPNPNPDPLLTL